MESKIYDGDIFVFSFDLKSIDKYNPEKNFQLFLTNYEGVRNVIRKMKSIIRINKRKSLINYEIR